MKTFNILKYLIFTVVLSFGLFACEDDIAERDASPIANDNVDQVYFPYLNTDVSVIAGLADASFTIDLARVNYSTAAEVSLSSSDTSGFFVIPNKVNFAAGDSITQIEISFSGTAQFLEYAINIELNDLTSIINPYLVDTFNQSSARIIFQQSDFSEYGTGQLTSWWYEETYAQTIEYSTIKDTYRLPNMMGEGYHFDFTWDGASSITPVPAEFETGYIYPGYGMLNAKTITATYDGATKTFTFTREWTLPSIEYSFGEGDDIYVMD